MTAQDKTAPAPDDSDREQILERLSWTPQERLNYLRDMVAFEERAHRARRLRGDEDPDPPA